MKTLYIDCGMGVAGDMLTAALLEIICRQKDPSPGQANYAGAEDFVRRFNEAGIPGVEMRVSGAERHSITGTRVQILVNGEEEEAAEHCHHDHDENCHHHHDHEHDEHCHHHHDHHHAHVHRSMEDIEAIISGLAVDDDIKADVLSVYKIIAEAEAQVHGRPAGEVHFHEVGAMDAVADVTAVCMLMRELAPDKIVASPLATGYGKVRCAHGVLPVPAPATAIILQGIPAYASDVKGELCTPTGAALIKHFAQEYSQMPLMRTEAIGCGIGTRIFEKATCLRAFFGESV